MKILEKNMVKISLLIIAVVGFSVLFLTYNTYGNLEFALSFRGKKFIAFILVGVATTFATITFQTITNNHFLTPSILGFDSLYILIQTLLFFFFGIQVSSVLHHTIPLFLLNVFLMVVLSGFLYFFLLKKGNRELYLLLMVGMILGTLFSSISTFLQVILDPNEYDKLQGKLFASFSNIDISLIGIGFILSCLAIIYLWLSAPTLDVLHLGRDQATSLGVNVRNFQIKLLLVVSLLVALSTALAGPVTFLGFIVVNLTYQWMGTYKHRYLFVAGSLISVLLLVSGQFFVEQVFKWNTTMSVVIEFVGGVYFVGKILHERKRAH
ncbi:iron chelate uptake ABC transporter family permease subunit [Vagococcus elongatus]|nr:iron chelate uptake ABC transporter family permease subunit [Vagococcus elongatus]